MLSLFPEVIIKIIIEFLELDDIINISNNNNIYFNYLKYIKTAQFTLPCKLDKYIVNLSNLQILNLSMSNITDNYLDILSNLKYLHTLDLSMTNIIDDNANKISSLKLKKLYLSGCCFITDKFLNLLNIPNLTHLYLNMCPYITNDSLYYLLQNNICNSLINIDVTGTCISQEEVNYFNEDYSLNNLGYYNYDDIAFISITDDYNTNSQDFDMLKIKINNNYYSLDTLVSIINNSTILELQKLLLDSLLLFFNNNINNTFNIIIKNKISCTKIDKRLLIFTYIYNYLPQYNIDLDY